MQLEGRALWIAFHNDALGKFGPTWNNLAAKVKGYGFSAIFPRAGTHVRQTDWSKNVAPRAIRICHDAGLKVVPWFYSVPKFWKEQVDLAKSLLDDGCDGICIDGELEWEGNHFDEAARLGEELRLACGDAAFIAHSPLPYQSYHVTYPYDQFAHFCDSVMIQAYWTGRPHGWQEMYKGAFPNWEAQIAKGSPRAKGFAPIGQTYGTESPYAAFDHCVSALTLDDVHAFDTTCRTKGWFRSYYSLEAASPLFWSYWRPDLSTPVGKQVALARLGLYTSSLDGLWQAHSIDAAKAFQTAHGLTVDGVVGPLTTAALVQALSRTI